MDPENYRRVDEIARRLSGPDWEQQRQFLANPLLRSLARAVGVDLASIDTQHQEMRDGLAAVIQAAIWFAPFGWTVSQHNLKTSDYVEAVALWQRSPDQAAVDEHLTRAWADPVWLRHSYGPMTTLAGRHEPTRDVLLARNRLLNKALSHHNRGEYEASVLIVLSQIDGITYDFTESKHGFFFQAKPDNFVDDSTIAGMPEFLRTVWRYVIQDPRETSLSGAFQRGPIMHGRQLAFGTEVNSTKAFALLAGVIDWLKPKAAVLTEKWQTAHEEKYAGSDERDEEGRHLDRRGFSETRESLRWLAIRETNEYRANGRYNADLCSMFQRVGLGRMQRRDLTTLTVAADGQSYWAWCPSDTDVCFGIAAHDGEVTGSLYADVGAPPAPGEDSRWVHESEDLLPDWSGD